ncbi:MAG: gluconate 2-dehydrogenase subunit 3 family protein [Gammaproteobacteria bacterium]|nr:gluconate 2-dehydrogenase subunit 3 family protein [Gammaproteobacteria bacterium]
MTKSELTRRFFLQGSGTIMGHALARAGAPAILAVLQSACSARDERAAFTNLTEAEAREVIAIAARIVPTTNTPGATEAGVVYFVDSALNTFLADSSDFVHAQLAEFQAAVATSLPSVGLFSELEAAAQDKYLRSIEDTAFFSGARFLTIAGVFGMSSWGGNKKETGWRLVGMDGPPHAWTVPFGYYDAQYLSEQTDDV